MSFPAQVASRRSCVLCLDHLESRWVPALTVPAYHSLPGAPAALYLDFDGHYQAAWGSYRNLTTQPFDFDGNPRSFSSSELNTLREVWQRVAEDFAPFNLDVTTVDPGNFADRRALRVAIGVTNGLPAGIGGLAYIDAFTNEVANVSYVLPNRLSNAAGPMATAIAHEAGHAFGLRHQSRYDAAGRRTDEYHPGNRLRAPIMGDGYAAERSVWWSGPTDRSAASVQDDMAVLARAANGFGYRPDDHGDSARTATALGRTANQVRIPGQIGRTTDQDWFSFTTTGGAVSLTVQVAAVGSNLDAVLEIYRETGGTPQRVALAAPSDNLGASVRASLSAGTYYAVVRSQGAYGDVGTYTLTGTIPGGNAQAGPSRVAASRPEYSGATSGGQPSRPARLETPSPQPHLDQAAVDVLMGAVRESGKRRGG